MIYLYIYIILGVLLYPLSIYVWYTRWAYHSSTRIKISGMYKGFFLFLITYPAFFYRFWKIYQLKKKISENVVTMGNGKILVPRELSKDISKLTPEEIKGLIRDK